MICSLEGCLGFFSLILYFLFSPPKPFIIDKNNFCSSLVDSAKVYSDQDEIMRTYKKEFKNHIYPLNYDKLVTHPSEEIKSLIHWLGWSWNDLYLSPHLNKRKVSTRSNVQVRSSINAKSLGGWKNYKEMLKPAMEIITKKEKYKDLKY